MINIEYAQYDIASDETEVKDYVKSALKYKLSAIFVLPSYLKCVKNIVAHTTKLGCPIDFPFGLSTTECRLCAIETAIKSGAQIIEIIAPSHALCNRKYDKFRNDINETKALCDRNNVELRYTIDYRTYTSDLLYKVAQILAAHQIETIYPSNNFFLDNISDNILVSMLISQKIPVMSVIINGNAWHNDHVDLLLNNQNITNYRTNNLYFLEKLYIGCIK